VLQTHQGYPVAWDGSRGTIDAVGDEVRVDPGGQVWQGGTSIGRLKLVNFDSPDQLRPNRNGLLTAPAAIDDAAYTAEVRQGYLESANVNAVDEMVAMISAQRSFESAARMLSMIDQTYRRLLSSQR